MSRFDYDLMVIGTGPSGQKAAIQGAKAGKRVAIVEKKFAAIGGVCVTTGTIPSKTLREAVLYLSGFRERNIYGASYRVKQSITMDDLVFRTDHVMRHEMDVIKHQMLRNNVDLLYGSACFVDPHTLRVDAVAGEKQLSAGVVVVAVGTRPTRQNGIPFAPNRVVTNDGVLNFKEVPRSLTVIGAGVIGVEYASIFAALGTRVTLIDMRPRLLDFVDDEIIDALTYHLRGLRVTIRLGEKVERLELDEGRDRVVTYLASGKKISSEKALYAIGRTGNTQDLNLKAAGLKADDRGRLQVNEHYQTAVPHIYAVGDVIGFPSLASTSMEQGRLASAHAFKVPASSIPALFPYGIYTIPEISMVGKTEEELTAAGTPYEVGKAYYKEISRGQIIGDEIGMLKLIFGLEDRRLLGVHIIGEGASELVHIGQAVMAFGGTVDYFVSTVFNYPTLAEAYKVAALDGVNRLNM